jgi:ppGpp synthetase/RelA/SpoT-type nucleotidyltranferase
VPERTIEDKLREEYFELLPNIRRVMWQLEAEIRYYTLPILHSLKSYEQLVVKSRVKDCESALTTLSRNKMGKENEGRTFDPERPGEYSMLNLPDLAGVRVLVFPNSKLIEVDNALRDRFRSWTQKPVKNHRGEVLAPKYYGYCDEVSSSVRGEYQIVPMLLGLFWEVEHSAMYKYKKLARSKRMRKHRADVELALSRFEEGVESFVRDYTEPSSAIPKQTPKSE